MDKKASSLCCSKKYSGTGLHRVQVRFKNELTQDFVLCSFVDWRTASQGGLVVNLSGRTRRYRFENFGVRVHDGQETRPVSTAEGHVVHDLLFCWSNQCPTKFKRFC